MVVGPRAHANPDAGKSTVEQALSLPFLGLPQPSLQYLKDDSVKAARQGQAQGGQAEGDRRRR